MAGEFTAGLSGGQRKMLMFEMIYQRTLKQEDLLIVLDEPFAGVTDDFVPYIVERLDKMRQQHNILLVTNDHVQTLTKLSDNTITVSAIDRSKVEINDRKGVDREQALIALSIGDNYAYKATMDDLKFFYEAEIRWNAGIIGVIGFALFSFTLFIATFWDSSPGNEPLVLVAAGIIAFFCVNPYLLTFVEWRNTMTEEAEALMHASASMNKFLKVLVTIILIVTISTIEFGVVNLCIGTLKSSLYLFAMMCDSASLTFPLMAFGLYTTLPFQAAQVLGSSPFLFMIFFSTTFSPGSGVEGFKAIRYLFARFYFWCVIPGYGDLMEGCPDRNIAGLCLFLTGILGVFLFSVVKGVSHLVSKSKKKKASFKRLESISQEGFLALQLELFGEKALHKFQHLQESIRRNVSKNALSSMDEEV